MKPNKNSTFNQFTGASEFIRASTQTADIKNYLKANKNSDNLSFLLICYMPKQFDGSK